MTTEVAAPHLSSASGIEKKKSSKNKDKKKSKKRPVDEVDGVEVRVFVVLARRLEFARAEKKSFWSGTAREKPRQRRSRAPSRCRRRLFFFFCFPFAFPSLFLLRFLSSLAL